MIGERSWRDRCLAITVSAQGGQSDHHDLHSRPQPCRKGGEEPGGHALTAGATASNAETI